MQKGQDNEAPRELGSRKITDLGGEAKPEFSSGRFGGKLKLFLIAAALVVALDQLSKLWIRDNLPQTASIELLPGFIDLVHVRNYGAFLGLLADQTELLITLGIAGSGIILVFLYFFRQNTTLGMLSFALILGGSLGNLIDRIHLGYVIDFISNQLFYWPAFNIADAAMTVGIFTLIYSFYKLGVFRKAYEPSHRP